MICSGFVAVAFRHHSGLPDLRGAVRPVGGQICDEIMNVCGGGNRETRPDLIRLP
jgi:hypothetical protein